MNSLVRVFSNFKEFYSEINGATLTGAIDVIVVEQPDGEFLCSPFHVRFGKLGVLRSREKIVDIEINGEPVDIHMRLGDSGEAFFVEECSQDEIAELPDNLATSPIPIDEFNSFEERKKFENDKEEETAHLPIPRRNSIDFSAEYNEDRENKFENQESDFKQRRYTDNILDRRNLFSSKNEYTTQKLRQKWAEHEEKYNVNLDSLDKAKQEWNNTLKDENKSNEIVKPQQQQQKEQNVSEKEKMKTVTEANDGKQEKLKESPGDECDIKIISEDIENKNEDDNLNKTNKEDSKSKKKRRRRLQMKKKMSEIKRKNSSNSSNSSIQPDVKSSKSEPISILKTTTATDSSYEESLKIDEASSSSNSSSSIDNNNTKTLTDNKSSSSTVVESISEPIVSMSASVNVTPNRIHDLDIHFFSDTEVTTGLSPHPTRPSSPIQSDSELEINKRENSKDDSDIMTNSASWKWGELPETKEQTDVPEVQQRNSMLSGMFSFMKKTNKMRKNVTSEGVYLSELDSEGMDPEIAALYLPKQMTKSVSLNLPPEEEDQESGNGTSLPNSPSSMEGGSKSVDSDYDDGRTEKYLDFVAMSLCGGLDKRVPTNEEFDRHIVKYSDVCKNPGIYSSSNLVVRINDKYYSWTAACPIVMTILTYQKPLTEDAIEQLMNVSQTSSGIADDDNMTVSSVKNISNDLITNPTTSKTSQETKRGYSWWYWRRSADDNTNNNNNNNRETVIKPNTKDNESDLVSKDKLITTKTNDDDISSTSAAVAIKKSSTNIASEVPSSNISVSSTDDTKTSKISQSTISKEKYRKKLRLSSDSIKSLNLKPGMNEIEFSVTTAYQGTSRCKCYLFRWKYNDKVVISDIDGTITKSDVLGHILPMVGKDWAQIGVAQLFSKIEANGYKLLYLSARAIGQSRVTREYLRSIRQGDVKLPDGPLLLNPTSLLSAFHREVIEKKPEQFKIACLTDIQQLFPKNPFYAGYGNRINDVWAYRAVGIPIMRIFTINTKGELKHELTQTFQSSYTHQSLEVNEIFPPYIVENDDSDEDYDVGEFEDSEENNYNENITYNTKNKKFYTNNNCDCDIHFDNEEVFIDDDNDDELQFGQNEFDEEFNDRSNNAIKNIYSE